MYFITIIESAPILDRFHLSSTANPFVIDHYRICNKYHCSLLKIHLNISDVSKKHQFQYSQTSYTFSTLQFKVRMILDRVISAR
jgi:hypothetical protein